MPTVHLSLPDRVYRELRREAEALGIQVTDLIKIYINAGLNGGHIVGRPRDEDDIMEIKKVVAELSQALDDRFSILESRIYNLRKLLSSINRRVSELEETVEEIRPAVVEPEILHTPRKR